MRPPNAGKGRKKGVPNKTTKTLKDMILGALSKVGGQEYLQKQAEANPTAFMTLIGKVLPTEVNANVDGQIIVKFENADGDHRPPTRPA